MSIITVFLIVLVISLLMGNALISFFSFGQRKTRGLQFFPAENALENKEDHVPKEPLASPFLALNQKILLLSRQMQGIDAKMSRLDNFRANTQVEMKGIMEILTELQNKHITTKAKSYTKKDKDLSTRQMHKIIYRSR